MDHTDVCLVDIHDFTHNMELCYTDIMLHTKQSFQQEGDVTEIVDQKCCNAYFA